MKHFFHKAALLLLLLLIIAPTAPARELDPELFRQISKQVATGLSQLELDPAVLAQFGMDARQMTQVRNALVKALDSGSLHELAPLRPYAEQALSSAERVMELRPFAAWLRARLDYFQVADEVVRRKAPPAKQEESDYSMWLEKIGKRHPPARAAKLVPQLKPVFRAQGVPEEMVWLAEVESSFNPAAESPVGARGLYQFMPATAGRFGLELQPKDQRLDPRKSAEAAAKYLKILHRRFGSWSLALAAYNCGEGRVGRLLKKHGGSGFDDIAAHLPAETRMYVPKMRAVLRVRENVDLMTL